MYDAIYARQSIEKADSISIESQIEYCRYEVRDNPWKEYTDKGFSGKNTRRPGFEEMLKDIRQRKISRVIVYKLDRISRSILDFSNMINLFQEYQVEFISSTEKFDTSTPIGRAMLHICIVFAQLERETIQKRVTDSYYSRCKRGFYMGGRIPYGFTRCPVTIDGKNTSMYVPVPKEAQQIRLMYSLYANPENSLGDIIRYFDAGKIPHLRGGMWNTARISDILRNPIYVRADADIYQFFKDQGTLIVNPVDDFTGTHACYLYKSSEASTRKNNLKDTELVLAPHEGIVSSQDWIACRMRCLNNRKSTQTCKAKNSWLAGKVKCQKCGYSMIIAKADTKWQRYFICGAASASKKTKCPGAGCTIYASILEEYVAKKIRQQLTEFPSLTEQSPPSSNPKINENNIQLKKISAEAEALLKKTALANAALLSCINNRIAVLDAEQSRLTKENASLLHQTDTSSSPVIRNPEQKWEKLSLKDKQKIADILINVITIGDNRIEIIWNI